MIPTFLHVPRSGGTTLREALRRRYRPEEILEHDDSTSLDGWLPKVQLGEARHVRLIMGHLPIDFPWAPGEQERSYFTFLREPVDRVLSDYYNARSQVQHRFHQHCLDLSLEEAIAARQYINLDNLQVRMFANALQVPFGQVTSEHYARAIEALMTRFAFVGFTEHFDDGVVALEMDYDWPGLRHQLAWRNRLERPRTPGPELHQVEKANAWDLVLYQTLAWHLLGNRRQGR